MLPFMLTKDEAHQLLVDIEIKYPLSDRRRWSSVYQRLVDFVYDEDEARMIIDGVVSGSPGAETI